MSGPDAVSRLFGKELAFVSGDRACSPAETYARVASLLPSFGITRVARQTGLDRIGVPVWLALTPNARSIVVAQGKGATDADARTSAVMEALERVVAGAPACAVHRASPEALAAAGQRFLTLTSHLAPRATAPRPDEVIDWVTGTDLLDGGAVSLPEEAIVLDRSRLEARYWQSSDGLASGNTLEEAIVHAVYERIERDAQVLWQIGSPSARAATCIRPQAYAGMPALPPSFDSLTQPEWCCASSTSPATSVFPVSPPISPPASCWHPAPRASWM